ncbi:hypothetical protein [Methanofollis fontis]|uniref:hypothetical protein n=1 Tax=Methanofollis fontis TaxID=2052832 RepID=UPI0013EEA93E|nr:hypothetical protein [Methanofollis fontis]
MLVTVEGGGTGYGEREMAHGPFSIAITAGMVLAAIACMPGTVGKGITPPPAP